MQKSRTNTPGYITTPLRNIEENYSCSTCLSSFHRA